MPPKNQLSKKKQEQLTTEIKKMRKKAANLVCCDCGKRSTPYICMDVSSFICTPCSGLHREINHRVKSIAVATFKEAEVAKIRENGNEEVNRHYLARYKKGKDPFTLPREGENDKIKQYIQFKYIQKKWYKENPKRKIKKKKKKKKHKKKYSDEEEEEAAEPEPEPEEEEAVDITTNSDNNNNVQSNAPQDLLGIIDAPTTGMADNWANFDTPMKATAAPTTATSWDPWAPAEAPADMLNNITEEPEQNIWTDAIFGDTAEKPPKPSAKQNILSGYNSSAVASARASMDSVALNVSMNQMMGSAHDTPINQIMSGSFDAISPIPANAMGNAAQSNPYMAGQGPMLHNQRNSFIAMQPMVPIPVQSTVAMNAPMNAPMNGNIMNVTNLNSGNIMNGNIMSGNVNVMNAVSSVNSAHSVNPLGNPLLSALSGLNLQKQAQMDASAAQKRKQQALQGHRPHLSGNITMTRNKGGIQKEGSADPFAGLMDDLDGITAQTTILASSNSIPSAKINAIPNTSYMGTMMTTSTTTTHAMTTHASNNPYMTPVTNSYMNPMMQQPMQNTMMQQPMQNTMMQQPMQNTMMQQPNPMMQQQMQNPYMVQVQVQQSNPYMMTGVPNVGGNNGFNPFR